MTRRPATLTAAFVRTVSKPGVYGDGRGSRGLSLRVHRMKSGRISRTWRQRLRVAGRLTTTGLGRFPEVSLAEARHKAIENARAIGQGVTRAAAASRRFAKPPKRRSGYTPNRGKPARRSPRNGTRRSGCTPRRSGTSRWTGSRRATCWRVSGRYGT